MTGSDDSRRAGLAVRMVIVTTADFVVLSAVLFAGAGTLDWPAAWVYLAVMFFPGTVVAAILLRHDPGLVAERMRWPVQAGQSRADRLWVATFGVLFLVWLPLMGLDAVRFAWSHVPVWVQVAGGILAVAGLCVAWGALWFNSYASTAVRLQPERGQHVVSGGPYAYVRHPMYSGALMFLIGSPLLLGSWLGLAFAVLMSVVLAVRAVLEERTLAAGLEGYADYMRRVRHRLVPGVW